MHAVLQRPDVLVDAVEHDDRVVEAVAHDGEQRRDDVGGHLVLRPGVDAGDDDEDLDQRQDAHQRHLELVADRDEQHDEHDDDREGDDHGAGHVAAPVRADGLDAVGVVGQTERGGDLVGGRVGLYRVGLAGAHHEAGDVVGRRGLDRRVCDARRREGVAHLGYGHRTGVVERDLGAAQKVDAEVEAPDEQADDGGDHHGRRDGKQDVAVLDELDLAAEVATHRDHLPSRPRHALRKPPRAPRGRGRPCPLRCRRARPRTRDGGRWRAVRAGAAPGR